MPKLKPLTEEQVSTLKKELKALPPKKMLGAAEAIDALYEEIKEAMDNGHTEQEMVKILADKGIPLKESSFRNYMRQAKANRKPKGEASSDTES